MVSCYLPLTSAERLPKEWGTRHRAAIGLTERCDAWVVMVSEENGQVFIVRNGKMEHVEKHEKLSGLVLEALTPVATPKTTLMNRIRLLITHRWPLKAGSFALVCLLWLMLAGQQDFEVNLRVPVEIKNVPSGMEVLKPSKPEVEITFRGLRKDASTLNDRNVHVELDLSLASMGKKTYSITRDQILLPNDRIQIVGIEPARFVFEFSNAY